MNTTFAKLLIPAALLGTMMAPVAAKAAPTHHHSINGREHQQNHRIYQGVRHGSLTPREAAQLERREANLRRQEYHARLSGGRLTTRERARLQRKENHVSQTIYHQKHDRQHR
jgi:hypothetical protein